MITCENRLVVKGNLKSVLELISENFTTESFYNSKGQIFIYTLDFSKLSPCPEHLNDEDKQAWRKFNWSCVDSMPGFSKMRLILYRTEDYDNCCCEQHLYDFSYIEYTNQPDSNNPLNENKVNELIQADNADDFVAEFICDFTTYLNPPSNFINFCWNNRYRNKELDIKCSFYEPCVNVVGVIRSDYGDFSEEYFEKEVDMIETKLECGWMRVSDCEWHLRDMYEDINALNKKYAKNINVTFVTDEIYKERMEKRREEKEFKFEPLIKEGEIQEINVNGKINAFLLCNDNRQRAHMLVDAMNELEKLSKRI